MTQYEISRRAFMGRLGAAGGLLVSGGLLAACGSDDSSGSASASGGGAKGPLKLGYARPTTGATASSFALLFTPADMAIAELNGKGGIDGHKIVKVDLDDKGDPAEEPGVFRKFKEQGVHFVVGPNSSGTTLGALPISTSLKILNLSSAVADALGDAGKYPYTFQMNASAAQEARAVVEWCVKEKGYKRIAIIYADDPFGQTLTDDSVPVIKELGAELVGKVSHESVATAMTPFLSSLKKNNPDVILQWQSVAPTIAATMKSYENMGWNPPAIGHCSLLTQTTLESASKDTLSNKYGFYLRNFTWADGSDIAQKQKDYVTKLKSTAPDMGGQEAVTVVTPSYDFVYALSEAITKAGTIDDTTKVKTAMEGLGKWEGMLGTYAFGSQTHSALDASSMVIASAISGTDPKAETFFRERVSA
ncbi:ABC transporter substrate-binding protein [Solirubrobacter ginsenosidimutans]|uniref:ABC transporter substrate-binding protein n=1 Tax=Solirubrobacter ginsenosidimutans TaxID=490573 RepID=A0A9X3MSE1_9ACTN|nr:ABC transporter substrate-binding protein [Solirubrobacter ginsenosidimutans]MDA0160353.1 ABC transporter substrate-binding protein [Solirubrobacter ginsenosidimutans]